MAAPAHVQGYAEGGALYSMVCVAAVGVVIAAVSMLHRKARDGAIWHGLYIQGLVTLYYLTQTSFRGAAWHSYGLLWSAFALVLVGVMSKIPGGLRSRLPAVRVAPNRFLNHGNDPVL